MIACYGLRTYGRYITHSSTYPIEVAAEEAMLDLETSGAVEEVIEETLVESSAIVEAMAEAIEEHRADIEAIEEYRPDIEAIEEALGSCEDVSTTVGAHKEMGAH